MLGTLAIVILVFVIEMYVGNWLYFVILVVLSTEKRIMHNDQENRLKPLKIDIFVTLVLNFI